MGLRLLLLCLVSFLVRQNTDLSQFLNAIDGEIIHVNGFQEMLARIKCEPVTECPGIIIAVFSGKGKRLSLKTCSFDEVKRYQLSPEQEMYTLCFLVNHKIFVYKGEPEDRRQP